MTEKNGMLPMLYLCATPIGNMEDITLRALRALRSADMIYCEDTRHTSILLSHFGIRKPLVSCHEHNEMARAEEICSRVGRGEIIVYVSDAGMPGISDPGERLVALCIKTNTPFTVLPGASAMPTALVLSGLGARNACFAGFLPREKGKRLEAAASLARHGGSIVIYESPLRLSSTAAELADTLGDRRCALCRELTKLHEEVVRSTLSELAAMYSDEPPRGECVLVIEGAGESTDAPDAGELARSLLEGGASVKDAAKRLSAIADISRNDAYTIVNRLNEEMKH